MRKGWSRIVRRSLLALAAVAFLAASAVAYAAPQAGNDTQLALVAYSTPTVAFGKLISAFQQTPAGSGVSFTQSYAGSEVQARAIIAGQPADVVDLSHEADLNTLVSAGIVSKNWNKNSYHGFVSRSVVVFVVRNGNPKHIRTWDDLIKPGVDVVAANPFSSGGARWNVLAAYGAQLRAGKTPKQAIAYLNTLFHHVVAQDTSARNALNTFLSGKGDVLLTYENEAILAQQQSKPVYYLIPKATIQIENPIAVTTGSKNKQAAQAFVNFATSAAGQKIWADNGYRPVLLSVFRQYKAKYPPRPQLFKVGYVGGWTKATKQFFDPTTGIMAKIEQGLGVSTGG
jgi:sulfate/thiosulfate transport system substrate-binding protein